MVRKLSQQVLYEPGLKLGLGSRFLILHFSEINEIVEKWAADLGNQLAAAEIALSAPEVTWDDLESILEGSYPATVEEFESMISQS